MYMGGRNGDPSDLENLEQNRYNFCYLSKCLSGAAIVVKC